MALPLLSEGILETHTHTHTHTHHDVIITPAIGTHTTGSIWKGDLIKGWSVSLIEAVHYQSLITEDLLQFWVDIFKVPSERFTVEILSKFHAA